MMAGESAGPRMFHSSRAMAGVTVGCALLFAAGTIVSYRTSGLSWMTAVFLGLLAFGVAGIADVLTQRVELHADRIVIVRNLRKRVYPRQMFVKAAWGKGVPVSIQKVTGEWVDLPAVGASNQGLANTLRAWIGKA